MMGRRSLFEGLSLLVGSPVTPRPTFPDLDGLLREFIAPQAAQLDSDPDALRNAFQWLGSQNLLGLKVPVEWGGRNWKSVEIYRYTEQVARYSGALAFLQTQHQSAVGALAKSDNEALKTEYLRAAAGGEIGLGVGYSQLRRTQQPPVTASECTGGYLANGTVPWITGYGTFQHFILGAQLPDGRALLVLTPLSSSERDGGQLSFREPMQLAAMQSTQTVKATLSNWFVPDRRVIGIQPAGWIHTRDRLNPLSHSFFALGCARAGLDVLENAQKPEFPAIGNAYRILDRELTQCRTETYAALSGDGERSRLELRAWAIELAVRCAHAAVTASRGAANYSHHPAQRVYREALAFTVFGQNTDVMNATLEQITSGH